MVFANFSGQAVRVFWAGCEEDEAAEELRAELGSTNTSNQTTECRARAGEWFVVRSAAGEKLLRARSEWQPHVHAVPASAAGYHGQPTSVHFELAEPEAAAWQDPALALQVFWCPNAPDGYDEERLVLPHLAADAPRGSQSSYCGHVFRVRRKRDGAEVLSCTAAEREQTYAITAAAVAAALPPPAAMPDEPMPPLVREYTRHAMAGFDVRAEAGLLAAVPELRAALEYDLEAIANLIPAPALGVLRDARIYVNAGLRFGPLYKSTAGNGLCVHWDRGWLRGVGNMEEKEGHVEVYRASGYLRERAFMPMVLLHELTHALHFRLESFVQPRVDAAYAQAMADGKYESVDYVLGGKRRAYAAENAAEYVAECAEAYWGTNDYYPFVRSELEAFDPAGAALCRELWNLTAEDVACAKSHLDLRRQEKGVKWKEEGDI